jgi:hypothetical protein
MTMTTTTEEKLDLPRRAVADVFRRHDMHVKGEGVERPLNEAKIIAASALAIDGAKDK